MKVQKLVGGSPASLRARYTDFSVTDGAGNRNNLLVVTSSHIENACVNKRVHAKPLACSKDSSQDSAWESMELALPSHSIPKSIEENHQKHCNIQGHFNPKCSREGYVETAENTPEPTQKSESMSGRVDRTLQRPQFSYHKASSEHCMAYKAVTPSLSVQEVDIHSDDSKDATHKDDVGNRKMSNIDIEKIKLLMSIPSSSNPSKSLVVVHDGNISELDNDYGVPRLSSGLIERTNSHAPLLPHECLTCDDVGYRHHEGHSEGIDEPSNHAISSGPESIQVHSTPDDLADLDLELFPSGAENILQRIATLHKELLPDEIVVFEHESPFGSPARLTKDAPTFAHELPPIGSPADARRQMLSYDSLNLPIQTGKQTLL